MNPRDYVEVIAWILGVPGLVFLVFMWWIAFLALREDYRKAKETRRRYVRRRISSGRKTTMSQSGKKTGKRRALERDIKAIRSEIKKLESLARRQRAVQTLLERLTYDVCRAYGVKDSGEPLSEGEDAAPRRRR